MRWNDRQIEYTVEMKIEYTIFKQLHIRKSIIDNSER